MLASAACLQKFSGSGRSPPNRWSHMETPLPMQAPCTICGRRSRRVVNQCQCCGFADLLSKTPCLAELARRRLSLQFYSNAHCPGPGATLPGGLPPCRMRASRPFAR